MFNCDYDLQNDQWNVFKGYGFNAEYVCSFLKAKDAQEFCKFANSEVENASAN